MRTDVRIADGAALLSFLTTARREFMHVIQNALSPASALPVERQIYLTAERRQFLKRRWRGVAMDGTEFGFDLESRLTDGCVIFQQAGSDYIVRQLPEMVYEIPCETLAQAALIGWKVGNLHLPAQIFEIGRASCRERVSSKV